MTVRKNVFELRGDFKSETGSFLRFHFTFWPTEVPQSAQNIQKMKR